MKRSIYCGAVREADIGSEHTACGWVQTKRDMGGVIFLDLRDREGILQVVCNAMYLAAEAFHTAEELKNESVIAVRGKIRLRDEETVNRKIETGTIELLAEEIEVLSAAGPLPYHLEEGTAVREDLRLAYRFLDIRRPQILNNLKFRHTVQAAAERFLDQNGFIQVETPILTKSTPEEPGTIWFRAEFILEPFTHCLSRPRSSSSF